MFEAIKYFSVFAFNAADKMEETAHEIAEKRRERMEAFRKQQKEMAERMREKFEEQRSEVSGKAREQILQVLAETGVATKSEVDELKTMISELSVKVDLLAATAKKK
ncbi:MAG: hypothetical protein C4521_03710 [Actinobacteria bacterium]|nr:MAG: hypothetical protein C4521_03710 [Actinomycetota bacterium]